MYIKNVLRLFRLVDNCEEAGGGAMLSYDIWYSTLREGNVDFLLLLMDYLIISAFLFVGIDGLASGSLCSSGYC